MIGEGSMTHGYDAKQKSEENWRAWGSWYSWGSPVGLGIYLLMLAGSVWIYAQLKHEK